MKHSEQITKTVEANGSKFEIVRVKYWGFNCNSLRTYWVIRIDGKWFKNHMFLRDAKACIAELTEPLHAKLCTPVSVEDAGRLLANT